jgi:hypothetical protein
VILLSILFIALMDNRALAYQVVEKRWELKTDFQIPRGSSGFA